MKMPRRRPRAVYEVYDADEALGEQEGLGAAQSPAGQEGSELFAERAQAAPALPVRPAFTRMLAGATLCLAVVCAIAAVSIALLHMAGGTGPARRRPASAPAARRDRRTVPRAFTAAAAYVPPAPQAPRLRVATGSSRHRGRAPFTATASALALNAISVPAPQAAPEASSGCECAPAEAEFGFER